MDTLLINHLLTYLLTYLLIYFTYLQKGRKESARKRADVWLSPSSKAINCFSYDKGAQIMQYVKTSQRSHIQPVTNILVES